MPTCFLPTALLLAVLVGAGAAAQTAPAADAARPVLRVATGEARPFVIPQGTALAGFSIDLWNAITQILNVESRLIDLGPRSDTAQLEAVRRGEADVAIAAITITAERERLVD